MITREMLQAWLNDLQRALRTNDLDLVQDVLVGIEAALLDFDRAECRRMPEPAK